MTRYQVLPATAHKRMRWSNGGGWTTEIVAEPAGIRWDWRLSVADVEAAGPFSSFPGIDRSIALLRGRGFALTVGERDEHVIDAPFQPFEFSGDEPTSCRLIDGPVQDLNLMTTRESAPRRLDFVHVAPHSTAELDGVDLAIIVAGGVRIGGRDLGYLDAVRRTPGSRPLSLTSLGGGSVVASATAADHR